MKLTSIPWMKQKLEVIYENKINGNLHLMYTDLNFKNVTNITTSKILDLLDDCNIEIDNNTPLYLYLPSNIDYFTKDLIINFKSLFKNNVYIIVGGYKNDYPNKTELDIVENLYKKFPELDELIDISYLIDNSKCYEIFTALSDTQRIFITPNSSCTISGVILNHNLKNKNALNANHISLVELLDSQVPNSHMEYYLKGLTNHNNNFNYNF